MGGASSKPVELTYQKPKLAALESFLHSLSGGLTIDGIQLSDTSQIHKIIAFTIALGTIAEPLITNLESFGAQNLFTKTILELDLSTGPDEINQNIKEILASLVQQEDLGKFDELCMHFSGILPVLSPIFADWISIFISGDEGSRKENSEVIREIIEMGAHESFVIVKTFYDAIPSAARTMMSDKTSIQKFLNDLLRETRRIIKDASGLQNYSNGNADLGTQTVETVYSYLGQILLAKIVEEQYRPAIKPASQALALILPLTFSILSINEYCTEVRQQQGISEIGPISTMEE